jgi:preprotein translocase subunit YajC
MGSDAFAQAAGAPAGGGNPMIGFLVQFGYFIPLFLILYFLLIRPQQQQAKSQESMRKNLKKGDRVVTTGGMLGTVVGIDDTKIVLRIADEVKAEFAKNAVVQVLTEEKK